MLCSGWILFSVDGVTQIESLGFSIKCKINEPLFFEPGSNKSAQALHALWYWSEITFQSLAL